ncbi:MAG: DUF2797 domain-containing protein [Granulosicoccaceae bacterium]|jgi:hypothetical protein
MPQLHGDLRKMRATLTSPVEYTLPVGDKELALNAQLGKHLTLEYSGAIHCIACGRKTSKSYNQGYCFPCLQSLAECDICIVKPEKCHFDAGTCRDENWAQDHCMQSHYVYLANSSGVKVGITRGSQIPTRWIDQGASEALPIARVMNRHMSGLVEIAMKEYVSDRTDWRKMLKGMPDPVNLGEVRDELFAQTRKTIQAIRDEYSEEAVELLEDEAVTAIDYPVLAYPAKVTSLNFDKTPLIEATLQGIKGQYLIFDTGVLNIRKFGGYEVTVKTAR